MDQDAESVWIELYLPKTKPVLVGVCYRPLDNLGFYTFLETSCSKCKDFGIDECVLLGDYSTDYQQVNLKSSCSKDLKLFLHMFDLQQLITTPTRITTTSSTILDLIIVSDCRKISQSGVLDISLSDHQAICCTRKAQKCPVNKQNPLRIRSLKNYIKRSSRRCWHDVKQSMSVEEAWFNFKSKFLSVLDKVAPYKLVRVKNTTDPGKTGELLHLLYEHNQCLVKFRETKLALWYTRYVKLRNQVQTKIKSK